ANAAPTPSHPPPGMSPKSQETKQAIFDSIPPAPPSSAAPTPPAARAQETEDEPTGQYDARDLLQQVEEMGRRSDPGRLGPTPTPDFPEPPTKPRIAIPAA